MKTLPIFFFAAWSSLALAKPSLYDRLEKLIQGKEFTSFIDDKRAVASYRDELRRYFGEENFSCEKFETVLADFNLIREKVPDFERRAWGTAVFRTVSVKLSEEEEAFTVRPLRPFHAIWFDTRANGCGQTTCELADPNAPERWAALLSNAQLFAVEKKGKFTGTVYLLVPLQDKDDRWVGLWTKESGKVPKELADAWIKQLEPGLTRDTKGIKRSFSGLHPVDPVANQIALALPRKCFGAKESRGENLLAGTEGLPEGNTAFWVDFKNPEAVNNLLDTFQTPEAPGKLAEVSPRQFQDLKKNLGGVLFSNESLPKRARAAQALGWLAQPVKRVDLPEMKVSGTTFAPRLPADQVTPLLSRALKDSSPLIRGAAAVNLADLGVNSPAINRAQQDLLNSPVVAPLTKGSKNQPPPPVTNDPNLLGRAAENSLRNGIPIKRDQLDRLFDSAEKLPGGKDQERLINVMARAYLGDSNPARALQFSQDNFVKNPDFMQKVADKVNSLSCPKREQYEKDLERLHKEET